MSRERDATGAELKVLAQEREPAPEREPAHGELAAAAGADPDRLLDGEDPDTLQVHDADHWIRVYQDLLAFKRQLLATAHEIVPDLADAARDEGGKTDLTAMDAEATKFERRLRYWQRHRSELAARQ